MFGDFALQNKISMEEAHKHAGSKYKQRPYTSSRRRQNPGVVSHGFAKEIGRRWEPIKGRGGIRLETLIELKFTNSSCSSLSSY